MLPVPEISEQEKEEIYRYIRSHNLTEALEAVLSGLTVIRPQDSLAYIEENLGDLKDLEYSEIKWDILIPDELRPKQKLVVPSALDFVLAVSKRRASESSDFFKFIAEDIAAEAELYEIAPELYDKACRHYNYRILRLTFGAVKAFIQIKREQEREEARKLLIAANFNHTHMCNITFKKWKAWAKDRIVKTKEATEAMRGVFANYVQQVIFDSWYTSAVEAKKTREYFERLERGDQADGEQRDEDELHEEGNDRVSLLPIEVSALIFTKLSLADMVKCSLVCRSWKVIIQSNALWNKVDLSPYNASLTDKRLINILTIGRPFVVHLNLQGCSSLTSNGFGFIAQCRNLQDVNFSHTNINDEVIEDIGFSSGSQMLYLNIANTKISDKALRTICSYMPHLQYLNIGYCQLVTDKGLYYLSKGRLAPQFRHIDVSGCLNISSSGFKYIGNAYPNLRSFYCNNNKNIDNDALQLVLKGCRKLRSVSVKMCPYLSDESLIQLSTLTFLTWLRIEASTRVSDKTISAIGDRCSSLRHFYISDCSRITEISMRSVAHLKSIVVINLADCLRINDSAVRAIVEGPSGPIIRELNLTNCIRVTDASLLRISQSTRVSDKTISAIGDRCSSLRHFYISDCSRITEISMRSVAHLKSIVVINLADCLRINDSAVRAIVEGPSGPIIRELNLTNCIRVTDASLLRISQRCASMRYLTLCHLELLTEAGMEFVASVKSLYALDLTGCNVQDGGMHNLANNTRLKHLNLVANTLITDLGIQKYVSSVPDVEAINVSFCVSLSDGAFKNIAYSCRKLTVLGLAGCTLVGDMTIQYISGACPFLTQLDISGCGDLTDKSLKFVRKGCRKLRVLIMLYCRNMTKSTVSKLKPFIEVVEWNGNFPPPNFKVHLNSVANLVVSQPQDNQNDKH